MSGLTIKDLERLSAQNPDYRMELVGGEIVVMSPSGYESDEVAAEIIRLLGNWVRPRRLGCGQKLLVDAIAPSVPKPK